MLEDDYRPVPVSDQELSFLWDKWKHHDDLMYRFGALFWSIQAIGLAALGISSSSIVEFVPFGLIMLGVIGLLYFSPTIVLARKCRNSFNNRIVEALIERGTLRSEEFVDAFVSWTPSKDNHSVNLWHTPVRKGNAIDVRASWYFQRLTTCISWGEIVLGIALFFYQLPEMHFGRPVS